MAGNENRIERETFPEGLVAGDCVPCATISAGMEQYAGVHPVLAHPNVQCEIH